MFLFHEAKEILSIRILDTEDDDILAWHFEKKDILFVRTTYKLAIEARPKKIVVQAPMQIRKSLTQYGKPLCQNCIKETPHLVVWI